MAQTVKNLPAVCETWVRYLGWEDSLDKGIATHSSIPGEFHGQRSLVGYSSWDRKELNMTEQSILSLHKNQAHLIWTRFKLYENNQYFGHLMWRANSLEKTLILGKIKDSRRRGQQRMRWLDGITDLRDMNLSKLWEIVEDRGPPGVLQSKGSQSRTQLREWTTKIRLYILKN